MGQRGGSGLGLYEPIAKPRCQLAKLSLQSTVVTQYCNWYELSHPLRSITVDLQATAFLICLSNKQKIVCGLDTEVFLFILLCRLGERERREGEGKKERERMRREGRRKEEEGGREGGREGGGGGGGGLNTSLRQEYVNKPHVNTSNIQC